MSYEIIFSDILSHIFRPLIFLSCEISFGGYSFGMGVATSSFQLSGHSPLVIHVFMMLVSGAATDVENCLRTLAGKSSLACPLFKSSCDRCNFTFEMLIFGIS